MEKMMNGEGGGATKSNFFYGRGKGERAAE
jgi:hypothetical protein